MLRTALFIVLASISIGAQSSPPPAQLLEVISVKRLPPNQQPFGRTIMVLPGGLFTAQKVPLGMLVNAVYGFLPERMIGAPKWLDTQLFDIDGRGTWKERPTTEVYRQIIQQVLVERFRLKVHTEPRPTEVYALVLVRRDGKLGPGLLPSGDECFKRLAAKLDFPPPKFPAPGQRPGCGIYRGTKDGIVQLRMGSSRMETLLSQTRAREAMGRLVVDRTGLQGYFDVELDFVPDSRQAWAPGQEQGRPATPNGPSLTTALRDQLGLRFEKRKEPVEVLVFDHVEMPAPN